MWFVKRKISIVRSAVCSLASVGIIRFLKEAGFDIIGTDIKDREYCPCIDLLKSYYTVNKAIPEEKERVIDDYIKIIKTNKDIKWIISGPETEILILADFENQFLNMGVGLFHPPKDSVELISNKLKMYTRMFEKKMNVPKYFSLKKFERLSGDMADETFILKPIYGRGSQGIFKVQKKDIEKMLETTILKRQDYLIQKFINGIEYSVDVLCDLDGNLVSGVVRRRIETDSGISVISKTEKNEEIYNLVEEICKIITFRGVVCIQFIKSEEDKKFYLTDINPRFGGGSILAIKASQSFRNNVIKLLKCEKINYNNRWDYQIMTMIRYYNEIFLHNE